MRIAPLPPLQCLVAFEASARHSSFTKAASELSLTQSAISRQIAQLEDFLGRAMFTREHRSLRLTVAGERYAKHVQSLLSDCSEATLGVMKRDGDLNLTIACSSGVATLWLTPRLGAFRALHPNINLRILVRDALASLSSSEFDVGLYYIREKCESHLTAQRLFDEDVFPVCAPSYLQRRIITPAKLAHETLLMHEDGQRPWMSWPEWLRLNDTKMPRTPRTVVINHYPQLVQLAIDGQGVVLGWRHMIDACLTEGLLVRATRESATFGGGYCVISPNERVVNQAGALFVRWLFRQAEQSA